MRRSDGFRAATASIGALVLVFAVPVARASGEVTAAADTVITVHAGTSAGPVTRFLTGVNHRFMDDGMGMWDPATGQPHPDVVDMTSRAGVNLIRYPGGTWGNLFRWRRAIGPTEERGCQIAGKLRDSGFRATTGNYGPDEHQRFVAAVGGQSQIMVPFAKETANGAANWVEYMNAPVGTNPRGGIAWADRRAANGHSEPYHVTRWEIGNEHYHTKQRYWLPSGSGTRDEARTRYIGGGVERQVFEYLGKDCRHPTDGVASDGSPNQVFELLYAPVRIVVNDSDLTKRSPRVWVGGDGEWTRVADLSQYGPNARVYEFDRLAGKVRFGDGVHGKIPPSGVKLKSSYDASRPGFVDFYREMKEADPRIEVCASWGKPDFPPAMNELGHADEYDCLSAHPYTNWSNKTSWSNPEELHDEHMLGDWDAHQRIAELRKVLRDNAPAGVFLAITEYGAINGPSPKPGSAFEGWNNSMSHVLYLASQQCRIANAGTPWVLGSLLTEPTLRTVIGTDDTDSGKVYVYTADAVAREALIPLTAGGGHRVRHSITNNPVRTVGTEQYRAIAKTATVDRNGRLNLVVVNRLPYAAVTATIAPEGFQGSGVAHVRAVRSAEYTDFNSAAHPGDVYLVRRDTTLGPGQFSYRFPKHSITLIQLEPA